MRGLILRAVLIGVAVVAVAALAGFGVGVALERSGTLDPVAEPDAATVRDATVVSFDCPDGNPIVALGRADRILVIGRDEEREWIELRSPLDAFAVVWLPAAQIDLHGEVGSLPVHECGSPRLTPATIPPNPADDRPLTTTSTTGVVISSTTTSVVEETTTTEPDGSTSSTSSTSSTTSTSTGVTLFPPTSTTSTTSTTTSSTSTTQPEGTGEVSG